MPKRKYCSSCRSTRYGKFFKLNSKVCNECRDEEEPANIGGDEKIDGNECREKSANIVGDEKSDGNESREKSANIDGDENIGGRSDV